MADPKWHDLQAINEKVAAYLESHRKITGDFERSLRNMAVSLMEMTF